MFRIVLNTVILPLELASLHLTSADEPGAATWWLLAVTLATAVPLAVQCADRLFGALEPESFSPV